jgi:hypothetical protein
LFARSFGRKPSPAAEREQEAADDTKHAVDQQQQQRAGALVNRRKNAKLEWEETQLERPYSGDTPAAAAAAVAGPHMLAAEKQHQGANALEGAAGAAPSASHKKKSAFKQLFANCKLQQLFCCYLWS